MKAQMIAELHYNNDRNLLKQFNKGCYIAFTRIYLKYWGKFYKYVLQLTRSEVETQDILQDVFTDLWLLRGMLSHVESLQSYVFSMVKSRTLRILYQEKRIPKEQIDLLTTQIRYSNWSVVDDLMARETESSIYLVIKMMPYRMQQTFVKSRFQGYSHRKIAEEMGVSSATVKKQIQHSLKMIRKSLPDLIEM